MRTLRALGDLHGKRVLVGVEVLGDRETPEPSTAAEVAG
jgi:hypothetical protein